MNRLTEKNSIILNQLQQIIEKNQRDNNGLILGKLCKILFNDLDACDLTEKSSEELYCIAVQIMHDINANKENKNKNQGVSIYNPTREKEGWESKHTIIQIITDDSPFIVSSVNILLKELNIETHWIINKPVKIKYDLGKISDLTYDNKKEENTEVIAIIHIEINNQNSQKATDAIKSKIQKNILTIKKVTQDNAEMTALMQQCLKNIEEEKKDEMSQFIEYLLDNKINIFGYRYCSLDDSKSKLTIDQDSCLGILKDPSLSTNLNNPKRINYIYHQNKEQENRVILYKSNKENEIVSSNKLDNIIIQDIENHKIKGEHQFIGLYPKSIYTSEASKKIELVQNKINKVIKMSNAPQSSHDYNQIKELLEDYPKDEMIQESPENIFAISNSVIKIKDRNVVKVFIRKDKFQSYVVVTVYMPRENFNTQIRKDTQDFLSKYFGVSNNIEWKSYFDQTQLTKTLYTVRTETEELDIKLNEIEQNLKESYKKWDDKLSNEINMHFGEAKGNELVKKYNNKFPKSYQENANANIAMLDISNLEELDSKNDIKILFYQNKTAELDAGKVRLKIYKKDEAIVLSEILPTLENFGLKVMNEYPYCINTEDDIFWISDFKLNISSIKDEEISERQQLFQEAFLNVYSGKLEDDGFNKLVLKAGISGSNISIIRSYSRYMRQIDATFSQSYIVEAITKHEQCAYYLTEMFKHKFQPNIEDRTLTQISEKIENLLEDITALDDDRIIRRYLDLIYATLRTNFYTLDKNSEQKSYISLKFSPELIPDMPLPLPKFEIFVYSPRFEGVHLRGGKVARGGLRWSDRMQDFRTEVLGLVKAQQVKNTVIVPSGAKGGFVCKKLNDTLSREEFAQEGKECYKLFIRGLLDITDNIVQNNIVRPENVVCHGEEDPYLVVAADKGTATFSDIANEISDEYSFWLSDAFASGGSNGYDHKKMGITAKGGWESVKRHFYEIGIDCQETDFDCIAIGDMSGDVFGNGMLLSKHIRLKAAFNHKHIFIDPNPDPEVTWKHRKEQFDNLKSWEDYDKSIISEGGGIFSRSLKSISLTSQMQEFLNTQKTRLTPNEIINKILKAKADLIWNGGIGTYIKSSKETHLDAGDRANDCIRINANEANVKIIGEGGNLGATQLGRIEFAERGGRINTDFIDNVGGVSCSDIEVNIKILINNLVKEGKLSIDQRNKMLEDMTEEVSDIVIKGCRKQTQTISVAEAYGKEQIKEQKRFIQNLERIGKLDREIEFIPSDEEITEKIAEKKSLTRPEISVLLSYAKMVLKEEFYNPNIYNDEYFVNNLLIKYFPKLIQEKYHEEIKSHALYKEIIATQLADQIVNDMGVNFVYRIQEETGSSSSEIGICYTIAKEIFCMSDIVEKLYELGKSITAEVKYEILHKFRRHTRRVCYWLLRNRDKDMSIAETINKYRPTYHALKKDITSWLMDEEVQETSEVVYKYEQERVSHEVAFVTASFGRLFSAMDITEIALSSQQPTLIVGELYFKLRAKCQLYWLLEQINQQSVSNHWQALARSAFREELDLSQKELTITALKISSDSKKINDNLEQWFDYNHIALSRWNHMLSDFKIGSTHEFAKFSVLLRELRILVDKCKTK